MQHRNIIALEQSCACAIAKRSEEETNLEKMHYAKLQVSTEEREKLRDYLCSIARKTVFVLPIIAETAKKKPERERGRKSEWIKEGKAREAMREEEKCSIQMYNVLISYRSSN